MAELKTFLFTDIIGSVELKGQMPGRSDAERDQAFIALVLTPHRARIERELAGLGGRVVSTAGDGHFLVFSDTVAAARWAIEIQNSHRVEPILTPSGGTVDVRISIHLGIPQIDPRDPNNFVGKPVDYAARLNDYATGGQILVSRSIVAVLDDAGMDGVSFYRHGKRELKGIGSVDIFELMYDRTEPRKMRRQPQENLSRQWTVLPATVGLTEFNAGMHRGAASGDSPMPGRTSTHRGAGGAQSEAFTDVVPARVGNYVLEERLGSGGMGDVYRARHSQFGRVRAVKVIKQHFVDAGQHEVIRRFYQEIKAVGALEHPNIVVAIDSSAPTDEIHYLVMEYIDGVGADQLVARHGPLPVAEACEIARQAARGLGYIHQHGMVHRDIKPSNLMLTLVRTNDLDSGAKPPAEEGGEQAVVKILDLGLALLVGDDQQRLTLFDNRAMGTAMYMSPEQWKSTSVDIRADVYSLGCTLYHLLAGQPPFWESDLRPEKAHEREKLPPLSTDRKLPPPLWELLEQMTAKKPSDRNTDPADVAARLAPLAEGHHLAQMVRQAVGPSPQWQTRGFGKGETMIAQSAESDTRLGGTLAGWHVKQPMSAASQRKLRRVFGSLAVLATAAAIVWLAIQTSGRRESLEVSRQRLLQVAANSAAGEIRNEIDLRFRILQQDARDKPLQQAMIQIDADPGNETLWEPLRGWLAAWRVEGETRAPSESWFITDLRGTQIARSPAGDSLGRNYSHRDYYHGGGRDFEPNTPDLKPIGAPHLSAVYKSTSDGTLRVAFSVPVDNGLSGEDVRKVVGVLAMSVDLGEFNVLEGVLNPKEGQEVVLIDLRVDYLDGEPKRGLILHHRRNEQFVKDAPPQRLSPELLARVENVLSGQTRPKQDSRDGLPSPHSSFLGEYSDPLSGSRQKYWGAVERVVVTPRSGEPLDTGWVVLVQEPVSR